MGIDKVKWSTIAADVSDSTASASMSSPTGHALYHRQDMLGPCYVICLPCVCMWGCSYLVELESNVESGGSIISTHAL